MSNGSYCRKPGMPRSVAAVRAERFGDGNELRERRHVILAGGWNERIHPSELSEVVDGGGCDSCRSPLVSLIGGVVPLQLRQCFCAGENHCGVGQRRGIERTL